MSHSNGQGCVKAGKTEFRRKATKPCPAHKGHAQVGAWNPKATLLVSQPLSLSPLEGSTSGASFYTLPPHSPLEGACPPLSAASRSRACCQDRLSDRRCRSDRQGSPWARELRHRRKPCGPEGTGSSKPRRSTATSALCLGLGLGRSGSGRLS